MFATWMEILSDTEGSVLWLIPGSDLAQQNLRRQAERLGVDPDRILFAGRMSKEQHLARLRLADLALDSRIVGGAATTSDALWAGVPVITIRGRHFASRMSASLLNAAGLPELVCHSLEDYAALAKSLAADAHRHAVVKQKLSDNTMTTELFDTEQGVRCLEAAYLQMWGDYCQGRRPRPFTVSEEMNGVARTPTRQGVR